MLLVSNRGAALDKDGTGFVPGRVVDNIRPISIGDAARRIEKKGKELRRREKKFLFRIIGRKVRNHFCDLICFRIIGLKIRNHLFDFLFCDFRIFRLFM